MVRVRHVLTDLVSQKAVTQTGARDTNGAMPKPPTSTRTVRLTDELWATIKADAEARGEAVNAVIARHLRIAYAPKDRLTVERIVDVTVASPLGRRAAEQVKAAGDEPMRMPRAPIGSRLKVKK